MKKKPRGPVGIWFLSHPTLTSTNQARHNRSLRQCSRPRVDAKQKKRHSIFESASIGMSGPDSPCSPPLELYVLPDGGRLYPRI